MTSPVFGLSTPLCVRGHVIFIDVVNEVIRERSMSYLKPEHQERVADAYHAFMAI